eukprot:11194621-Lingulodinium_polyedra.AAC.1
MRAGGRARWRAGVAEVAFAVAGAPFVAGDDHDVAFYSAPRASLSRPRFCRPLSRRRRLPSGARPRGGPFFK